jgi:hypothetical protein
LGNTDTAATLSGYTWKSSITDFRKYVRSS